MGFICSKEQYYPEIREYRIRPHYPSRKEHYVKCGFDVYWKDKKVDGVNMTSFQDLGHGYGRDDFNIFYRGDRMISKTYYKGDKISVLAFSAISK